MELSSESRRRVEQLRMDALVGRETHEARIAQLRPLAVWTDILAIALPIVYMLARYVAKDDSLTNLQRPIDHLGELISVGLIVLVAIKLGKGWSDKLERYSRGAARNILLASEARSLLSDKAATDADAEGLTRTATEVEMADRGDLNPIKPREKQSAYRAALIEFDPTIKSPCDNCGAMPLSFKPGSCSQCGGTPKK